MSVRRSVISIGVVFASVLATGSAWSKEPEDRRARGEATLAQITGEEGRKVVASLKDISPELRDWIIDFAYGDVFSSPAVSLCTRELATVSALTALGNAQPQLKVHIEGALNVGCKPDEIIAIIVQMAVYAGFPSAFAGNLLRRLNRQGCVRQALTALSAMSQQRLCYAGLLNADDPRVDG